MGRTHEELMREALGIAAMGLEAGELPIGAVVALDGEVIAARHTSEVATKRLLTHAELLALEDAERRGLKRRREMRLYTTVEPCLMCLGAAMTFGVGAVIYALPSPSDGAVALVKGWPRDTAAFPTYQTPAFIADVLRRESAALFAEYVRRRTSGGMWEWAKSLLDATAR
jgi:tRNA(adenine34) deaminase